MWFIVLSAALGQPVSDDLALKVAGAHFASQSACIDEGRARAAALSDHGVHGRYMCMYHGEPDREMNHAPKWTF